MKICIISSSVLRCPPPAYAGLEMITWQTAKGLAAKGNTVSLVAPDGSSCPGVDIISTGPEGQWDERQAFKHYVNALPYFDVIIDHSWQAQSFRLKMEGKINSPILRVHHSVIDSMYGTPWGPPTLPPGVEKPCPVCISQDQADHFEEIFRRPARVARNGIDLDFYKPLQVAERTEPFLFLARFSTIKGADLALEACKRADAGLNLIGDTTITGEPHFLSKCMAMTDDRRKIIGPAKRGECVWWYSKSQALIHPNQRFREPFGLAPVENLACGSPVIAWNYGAMRETVKHGETGILISNMDELVTAIIALRENPEMFNREWCRQWASQFSVGRMVDRYQELCEEAMAGGW